MSFICVHGFSRGGTNLLWNLLASHPRLISPEEELNRLVAINAPTPYRRRALIELGSLTPLARRYAGNRLLDAARQRADARISGGKALGPRPGESYTQATSASSSLVLKLVSSWAAKPGKIALRTHLGHRYIPCVMKAAPHGALVHVLRRPIPQAYSWMRRGASPEQAGFWYRRILRTMLNQRKRWPSRTILVAFDDILQQPAATTDCILRHFGYNDELPLRNFALREKPTWQHDGSHATRLGKSEKTWLSARDLDDFIVSDVDSIQESQIESRARSRLEIALGPDVDAFERIDFLTPESTKTD